MTGCLRCINLGLVEKIGHVCYASERIQKDRASGVPLENCGRINGCFEDNWSHPHEYCEWCGLNRVGKALQEGFTLEQLRIKID